MPTAQAPWYCSTCSRRGTAYRPVGEEFSHAAERILEAHRNRAPWCPAATTTLKALGWGRIMRFLGASEEQWEVGEGRRATRPRVELWLRDREGFSVMPWMTQHASVEEILEILKRYRACGADLATAAYAPSLGRGSDAHLSGL